MKRLTTLIRVPALLLACATLVTACGGDGGSLAAQTISFTNPGAQSLTTTSVDLVATASSGLTVSFASTTSSVCTVSGTTLTLVAAGDCEVTASQAGDSAYAAAAAVTDSITVSQASQTITFSSPGNQTLGTTPAALVATSTSGLTVSFASTTPTVCTVSGTTVALVAAGQCSIIASQAGSTTYAPAASVTDGFTVAAYTPPTLTFLSGYQATSTIEGGGFGGYAGSDPTSSCTSCAGSGGGFAPTVSAANSDFYYYYNPSVEPQWEYLGIYVQAPGVTGISSTTDTSGVQVADQTMLNFNLAENAEWYSSGATGITVTLVMGHLDSAGCNLNLSYTLTPTAAATTAYSVPLSAFARSDSCTASTTAAAALAAYPISQITFQGSGNAGGSAVQNTTTLLYPTQLTLTGAITFQ